MWLLERLRPDFKSIANFRKGNGKGIKNVCRKFVALCRQLNMFDDSVFAIDGSKFKAVNNKSKNYTPSKVQFHIDRVEKSIKKYLSQLDTKDRDEKNTDTTVSASKLAWLEARLMQTHHMERRVCYNVQSAVDTKHHLIVEHDVSMTVDRGQLTSVAAQVQNPLGKKNITIIADKGYVSRIDIKATQDLGMAANVPQTDTSATAKKGIFNKSLFKYDKNKDTYTCPAGEELPHRSKETRDGLEQKVYVNHIACRDCTMRIKYTKSLKGPRKMRRWVHEEVIDAMQQRLDENPEITILRKQTVEDPFGTIKMWMGAQHFLMKRKKNVSIEMSLHVLAYNLKRMMTIMGTTELMEAIRK
ncbi:MAG: hypothetical protein ACJASB_003915 [Shewanella psychromarinicola]|jgi:hypothetical protein